MLQRLGLMRNVLWLSCWFTGLEVSSCTVPFEQTCSEQRPSQCQDMSLCCSGQTVRVKNANRSCMRPRAYSIFLGRYFFRETEALHAWHVARDRSFAGSVRGRDGQEARGARGRKLSLRSGSTSIPSRLSIPSRRQGPASKAEDDALHLLQTDPLSHLIRSYMFVSKGKSVGIHKRRRRCVSAKVRSLSVKM